MSSRSSSSLPSLIDCLECNDAAFSKLKLVYHPRDYFEDTAQFCQALANNTVIEYVLLDKRFICALPTNDYHSILRAIGQMVNLRELEIWNASVPLSFLCTALQQAKRLHRLSLGSVGLYQPDHCTALSYHPSLQIVCLSDFRFNFPDEITNNGTNVEQPNMPPQNDLLLIAIPPQHHFRHQQQLRQERHGHEEHLDVEGLEPPLRATDNIAMVVPPAIQPDRFAMFQPNLDNNTNNNHVDGEIQAGAMDRETQAPARPPVVAVFPPQPQQQDADQPQPQQQEADQSTRQEGMGAGFRNANNNNQQNQRQGRANGQPRLDSFLFALSTCPVLKTVEFFSSRVMHEAWSPAALAALASRPSLQSLTLRRLGLQPTSVAALVDRWNTIRTSGSNNISVDNKNCEEASDHIQTNGHSDAYNLVETHKEVSATINNDNHDKSINGVSINHIDNEKNVVDYGPPPLLQLRVLDLNENSLANDGSSAIAEAALRACPYIRELNLRENQITATGCQAIASTILQHLTRSTAIVATALAQNGQDEQTVHEPQLASTSSSVAPLSSVFTLEKLNLAYNSVGDVGARALAEVLAFAPEQGGPIGLKHLELFRTGISDSGCFRIANALRTNESLTSLGLAYNQMSDESYVAFADALRANRTLKSINLQVDRRKITVTGCEALLDLVRHNYVLENVSTLLSEAYLGTELHQYGDHIQLFLRLNHAGRQQLFQRDATKHDWIIAMLKVQSDLSAIYYLVKANPSLLFG